jgi:hypothetical protein
MYDGAFGEYDDIFTKDIAPQTYAFCFSERELVICLDSSVLDSKAWSLIVENARKRLST